jgi:YebC/PmpR family DNA-binding regulatory protein
MSGHSKWATTKHKKAANDSRRAKLWAKLIRNIEVAARRGGSDVEGNPTLYDAVFKSRKNSVPNENIERAIRRGSGAGSDGVDYQDILYEGYAPGGIAVLVECLTDNRNRAAAQVRLAFTKNGGNLADPGSVSYQFSRKGVIVVSGEASEEQLLEATVEHGVDDISPGTEGFVLTCEAGLLPGLRDSLQNANIEYESAGVGFVTTQKINAGKETAEKTIKLVEALEDIDDVQEVYTNIEIAPDIMAQLS